MRPTLDPASHRVPRTKTTCLLHTWRPHRRRPFPLVLHLHQHQSSHNLHLQYLDKNQSTQRCQSLITQGSDNPPVVEPHMVLTDAWQDRRACVGRTRSAEAAWLCDEEECYMTYLPLRGCITTYVLGVVWSFAWPGGDSYILALGFPGKLSIWTTSHFLALSG
jgi:hypothetical protein